MQAAGENVGDREGATSAVETEAIFKNDIFKEIILILNSLQNLLDLQAAGIMSKKIDKMLNMLRLVVSL